MKARNLPIILAICTAASGLMFNTVLSEAPSSEANRPRSLRTSSVDGDSDSRLATEEQGEQAGRVDPAPGGGASAESVAQPALCGASLLDRNNLLLSDGALEIQAQRNPYARHYALPDGRKAAIISSAPIHFMDAHGAFQLVDDNIVPTSSLERYAYTNAANSFSAYFPNQADRDSDLLVRSSTGIELRFWGSCELWHESPGGSRTLLRRADTSTATLEGSTIRYEARYHSVTDVFTVKFHGVKHSYVLQERPPFLDGLAAGTLEFSEIVTIPRGCQLALNGIAQTADFATAEEIQIVNADGIPFAILPAPYAHEGAGRAFDPEVDAVLPLAYKVTFLDGGTSRIAVQVPLAWLNLPTREYPLTIDPSSSYNENHSHDDCYSWGATTFNYSADYMRVGYNSSYGVPYYLAFMTFHNVDIAPGSVINYVAIYWTAYDAYTNTCSFRWQFEDSDNALPCANAYPAGRNYVYHSTYISPYTTPWSYGGSYGVQDLSAGLQDVIDRSGWSSGNNVGLKWCAYSASGGYRYVRSYDFGSSSAPYIYVEYTAGGQENTRIAAYDVTTKAYSSFQMSAKLEEAAWPNYDISGRTVDFYINNNYRGSDVTDGNGMAYYTDNSYSYPSGTYTIKARFEGDSSYNPSEDTATLTVQKLDVTVTASNATLYEPGSCTLSAHIENEYGNPEANKLIQFYVSNNYVGQDTSNSSGNASITYSWSTHASLGLGNGNYTIRAQYDGGHSWNADSGTATLAAHSACDLAVQSVNAANGSYYPTEDIAVDNSIKDIGGQACSGYRVDFYASINTTITPSDYPLGYVNRPALSAGATHNYTTTATFPPSIPAGQYYIGLIVTCPDDNNASNDIGYDSTPITINAIEEHEIQEVPDYNQTSDDCGPVSASKVLAYWDEHSYGGVVYWSLIDHGNASINVPTGGGDLTPIEGALGNTGVVNQLRQAMGWVQGVGVNGWDVRDGVEDFCNNAPYSNNLAFDANLDIVGESYDTLKNEINAGRPLVYAVQGHPLYGNHAVTAVGYRHGVVRVVRVLDNWGSTGAGPEDVDWDEATFFIVRITPAGTPVDHYEYWGDDSWSVARQIWPDDTYEFRQTHNSDTANDLDWVKFQGVAGREYTMETAHPGSNADSYLYLYDTDHTTVLSHDDNSGSGLCSRIVWTCQSSGMYYIVCRNVGSASGHRTNYDLEISWVVAPGMLVVSPTTGFASGGNEGGPSFNPPTKQYLLSNPGGQTINWTSPHSYSWTMVSPAIAVLGPGDSEIVTVYITANANLLTASGSPYADTIAFTNTTNHIGDTTRTVSLSVVDVGPTALIDSILPNPAQPPGDYVSFQGTAYDNNGNAPGISAYEWQSDLDGLLANVEDFTASSNILSVGTHAVSFGAMDDEGGWSPYAVDTLVVNNALPTAEILSLIPPNPVPGGEMMTIVLGGHDNDENGQSIQEGQLTVGTAVYSALPGSFNFTAPSPAGQYQVRYKVRDDEGTWSPEAVVVLVVEPVVGTVMVDIEPNSMNCAWLLEGPSGYQHSGVGDETIPGLAAGTYSMTWGDEPGWATPDPEQGPLIGGGTLIFVGGYDPIVSVHVQTALGTPISGVEVVAGVDSCITSASGSCELAISYNSSGTVIPCKEGWRFLPPDWPYQNITAPIPSVAFTGVLVYDIGPPGAGDEFVGVGDFSYLATSWQQSVPPADPLHDFDCDSTVGGGDWSFFATAWLKPVFDPSIGFPPCRGCGRGREPSGENHFELALKALLAPSPNDLAGALPSPVTSVLVGQSYYLEMWVRDLSIGATGVSALYADVAISPSLTSVDSITPSQTFNILTGGEMRVPETGTTHELLVDELGGCTLQADVGINGMWARVATLEVRAITAGTAVYELEESTTGSAAYGRGLVPWSAVGVMNATVVHVPPLLEKGMELSPTRGWMGPRP